MAQQLLISLLLCNVWALLLWWACKLLLKKIPALQQWPGFYWWVLGLCFLPLLPLPQLNQHWIIPPALLQDTLQSMQTLTAQPQHPGMLQPAADLQPVWLGLLALLCVISLWQLYRLLRQWHQLHRFIRLSHHLAAADVLSPAQLATLSARVEIRQTAVAISPFVAGWRQMVLLVPAYIWQLSAAQRQLLLAHELVHLQRRDPQQLLLLRLVVAVCWFIPVLRRIEQAFKQSIELAVDQAVLAQQPGQAATYGQTLLHSLALSQAGQVSALAAGLIHGNADKDFYQHRLLQLFQPAPRLSGWQRWRISMVFAGTMVLLQLSSAALSYSAPPQQWQLPVTTVAVSSFYAEIHPLRQNRPHQGLDFAAATGVAVLASQQGKVLIADDSSLHNRYGKVVLIDHGHGYQTLYAHLNEFHIIAGQTVQAGEAIGTVGATGRVTGPHLHFEILLHGQQQNPAAYLQLE